MNGKTILITEEAYEYIRKIAFENKLTIKDAVSQAILNNVKGELE